MPIKQIKFDLNCSQIASENFHPLSSNGPYIDAHFGPLTSKTPVGQTYYIRPITNYTPPCKNKIPKGCGCGGRGEGQLELTLESCFPATHYNDNQVSKKVKLKGKITIFPFKWTRNNTAKIYKNQRVKVALELSNGTGLALQGLHIHDGVKKNGLTNFGPISYFLYTSKLWLQRYNLAPASRKWAKKYCPLPISNVVPANPALLLRLSEQAS